MKGDIIIGLSKLAAGCRACPYVDTCGHKRMEAVGFLPLFQSADQPLLRETMEIRVDGKPVTVYVDEIEKQLTRELYAHLGPQYGA